MGSDMMRGSEMRWLELHLLEDPEDAWMSPFDEIRSLREEVMLADKRIAKLEELLYRIPACPAHGEACIPHALLWVNQVRARGEV